MQSSQHREDFNASLEIYNELEPLVEPVNTDSRTGSVVAPPPQGHNHRSVTKRISLVQNDIKPMVEPVVLQSQLASGIISVSSMQSSQQREDFNASLKINELEPLCLLYTSPSPRDS